MLLYVFVIAPNKIKNLSILFTNDLFPPSQHFDCQCDLRVACFCWGCAEKYVDCKTDGGTACCIGLYANRITSEVLTCFEAQCQSAKEEKP